jgi:hypothetical protein
MGLGRCRHRGKTNPEARALPRLRMHRYLRSAELAQPLHDGEAESHALTAIPPGLSSW